MSAQKLMKNYNDDRDSSKRLQSLIPIVITLE